VFLAILLKRTAMVPWDQSLPKMMREPAKSSTLPVVSAAAAAFLGVRLWLPEAVASGHHITVASISPKLWFGVLFLLYLCCFRVVQGEHFCETFFG
jgi:hypothetical protein